MFAPLMLNIVFRHVLLFFWSIKASEASETKRLGFHLVRDAVISSSKAHAVFTHEAGEDGAWLTDMRTSIQGPYVKPEKQKSELA